jgi:hypothetical protein
MKKTKPISEEEIRELFEAYPVLSEADETVYLSKAFFRKLTDEQFTVLWYLPGLTIVCNKGTMLYVNDRRKALGLIKTKHNQEEEIKLHGKQP